MAFTNSTFTKILFIGDPHFKVHNNDVTNRFIEQSLEILQDINSKYTEANILCVLAGDILDTHERLHQTPLNKAVEWINSLIEICPVVILVGNHDYENNQQFLSNNHWMNCLKKWDNVLIVDRVYMFSQLTFVPYVPPGRFIEALNTIGNENWKNSRYIFAHQELKGCILGTQTSTEGDYWPLNFPTIVSGHIHKAHNPQANIIYPGSVVQHNFGEENNENGFLLIDIEKPEKDAFSIIPVNVPKRVTVHCTTEELPELMNTLTIKPLEKVRIICSGTDSQIKSIQKFSKSTSKVGVTVRFRLVSEDKQQKEQEFVSFNTIFSQHLEKNIELNFLLGKINKGVTTFSELL